MKTRPDEKLIFELTTALSNRKKRNNRFLYVHSGLSKFRDCRNIK